VLSFFYGAAREELSAAEDKLRIISDAFPLPHNRFGRYCCSPRGLALLADEKNVIGKNTCGSLVNAVIKEERDPKSGALIAGLRRKNGKSHEK
jgi:hypothetical protein